MAAASTGEKNKGRRTRELKELDSKSSWLYIPFEKAKCFPANMLKGIGANRPCRVNWEVILNATLNDIALPQRKQRGMRKTIKIKA